MSFVLFPKPLGAVVEERTVALVGIDTARLTEECLVVEDGVLLWVPSSLVTVHDASTTFFSLPEKKPR